MLKKLAHKVSQAAYLRIVKSETGMIIKTSVFNLVNKILEESEDCLSNSSDDVYFL